MTSTDGGVAQDVVPDVDGLRTTAATSVKWAVLQMVGATGGRLLFTFALARFLGPEDFGVVTPATVYIALAMLLLDQGFGAALVQRSRLQEGDVRSVATLNLLLSLALVAITMVLAPAVASFFDTPELTAVLRVLALGLVVKALSIVPVVMSRRAFEFRSLAILQTGAVVISGILGLLAVLADAGYWALVVQTVAGDALLLVGLCWLRGLPRFGLEVRRLRGMSRFSLGLLGSQLLGFAWQNVDNIAIGLVLGPTALGFYALSYRLQRFPLQLIGSSVNEVSLPIFSRLQDEPERRESWFLIATRFVVLLAWPTLVLMAVSANVAVPFLFGPAWEPSVVPLQLLTLGALTMISRWLLAPLATSAGRTGLVFGWSLVNVTLLVTAFLVAVQHGIDAVAASLGVVGVLLAVPESWHVTRALGVSWRRYASSHVPTVVGCIALAVVWRSVAALLDGAGALPVLVVATGAAVAAYALVVRLLWPSVVSDVGTVLKLARARR
jgi:O-antigen/teichoic acid export membrane protein